LVIAATDLAASKKADSIGELQNMLFGQGFGGITDLQVGPDDGYFYVLTYAGTVYRIMPASATSSLSSSDNSSKQ
jgi:aldose sugar dehydrogenase